MVQLLMFLTILLMLSGCTNKEFHIGWYDKCLPKVAIKIKKVYPNIPDDQLECKAIPMPYRMEKQSEVASYVVNLMEAGKDCESNLNDVKMIFNNFKDQDTTNVSEFE